MFRFGLLSKDRGLPRTGLLLYLKSPNGTGGDAGKYILAAGNAALFAAVGSAGFWYTDVNTPVARTAAEIEAWSGINLNHILFGKGLAVYEASTEKRIINKALKYFKEYPSTLDYTSNEDIFYDHRFGTVALQGTATWDGNPTIDADGVVAGNGPTLASVEAIDWSAGGTLTATFKMSVASDDISLATPQQLFGPIYATTDELQAYDGTNTASVATSWASGDVVTARVEVMNDGVRDLMRIMEVV